MQKSKKSRVDMKIILNRSISRKEKKILIYCNELRRVRESKYISARVSQSCLYINKMPSLKNYSIIAVNQVDLK